MQYAAAILFVHSVSLCSGMSGFSGSDAAVLYCMHVVCYTYCMHAAACATYCMHV